MKTFDDLIQAYLAADLDREVVVAWYRKESPTDEALSALADRIGGMFLTGEIHFLAANGLFNQLMPLAGFETAPQRFWEYYVAFENSETSVSPDIDALRAVVALIHYAV